MAHVEARSRTPAQTRLRRLEPYTHAMLRRRVENAVRPGTTGPRPAARWVAEIERLAAKGQFAFTLNYYAARGVKP